MKRFQWFTKICSCPNASLSSVLKMFPSRLYLLLTMCHSPNKLYSKIELAPMCYLMSYSVTYLSKISALCPWWPWQKMVANATVSTTVTLDEYGHETLEAVKLINCIWLMEFLRFNAIMHIIIVIQFQHWFNLWSFPLQYTFFIIAHWDKDSLNNLESM